MTFRYAEGQPNVIDDLSLQIKSGQYVAIVGTTGCGKSTLMRLLLGFEIPQKGAVYYDGKDLNTLDVKSLRRKIGTVIQDGALFSGDIYSNIVVTAPQLTIDEAWKAAELAGIDEDIRNMTYLTQEMDLPEKAKENLVKIDTSSRFLLSLINDVLDMSKAESGKIELHLEPYPVDEFANYVDSIIEPLCEERNQTFTFEPVEMLDNVVPLMDKLRINQVVFNLLSNAVKYTPEGGSIKYRVAEKKLDEGHMTTGMKENRNPNAHVDDDTPSFAISLYNDYRGYGIGTEMMKTVLKELKKQGYSRASLAVQKENYAVKMYKAVGFEIVDENEEEFIMVCNL